MKNFLLFLAFSFFALTSFSKEIELSPGSSIIVNQEPVSVSCKGTDDVLQYCQSLEVGQTTLFQNERQADGSLKPQPIKQFASILTCLSVITGESQVGSSIKLTAGSSAVLKGQLTSVTCADDEKAKYNCQDKFGRAFLFKKKASSEGKQTNEFMKGYESLDECLAFVNSQET